MTTPQDLDQAVPVPVRPPPPRVTPQRGTPLHELLGQREAAKAVLADAEARVKAIDAAIKNMLTQANPGVPVIDIAGDANIAPLRLSWCTPRRLDTDRLKSEQPTMYDYYLKWGTPYWQLRPVKN